MKRTNKRALVVALALMACATPQTPDSSAVETPLYIAAEATPTPQQMPAVQAYAIPITARCRDGWYSYSQARGAACAGHGGVRTRGPHWRDIR